MRFLVTFLFSVLVFGCGFEPVDKEAMQQGEEAEVSTVSTTYYYNEDDAYGDLHVAGYISPINISVNDTPYRDSEDFYTQELARLQKEVRKEYPDHKLSFDAAVGLRNFKAGMYVFLVASSENGIASESYVDSSGKFEFRFYDDVPVDKKALYTLRASKRIGLRLTNGNDVITWCYNMYAEKEMALEANPVILRHFHTTITKYQCSDNNQGIQIPEQDDFYTDTVDHSVDFSEAGDEYNAAEDAIREEIDEFVADVNDDDERKSNKK